MQKVTIRVSVLGQPPPDFDPTELPSWQSSIFSISDSVETYLLNANSKGNNWEYTDEQIEQCLNPPFSENIHIILVNVRLEDNWYVRRLTGDRIIFTFHEIADILRLHHIPLKNVVLRVLYAATLVYRRYHNRIPAATEITNYTHDETRGCLFDMTASKWDVIHSCNQPRLCDTCITDLRKAQVSNEHIDAVQREIKHIQKPLFARLTEYVRQHPVLLILITGVFALAVGIIGSLLENILYQ